MNRLPSLSARQCIRALKKAGFYESSQKGSHITFRHPNRPGKVIVPNHKALKRGTLRAIIRQAGLSVEEFLELL